MMRQDRHRPKVRVWAAVPVVVALMACGATERVHAESTRQSRPLTVSATGNMILPSIGAEVALQATNRLAFAVQLTQLLIAHVDLSVRIRVFVLAGDESGVYLGPVVHAWYSPLILHGVVPVATMEAGYEHRAPSGFTVGLGVGGGMLWDIHRDTGGTVVEPVAMANLRLGKSW